MSDKKPKISLTPSQQAAVDFSGEDLLISAGAGSGKTATLTRRIAERLTVHGDDIGRKLIVTFTKEAANELRVRINKALCDALKDEPQNKRISEQLVRLGSADICTIDSFCLKLVRANFEKLGIDGGFRISDESENEVLCREAISEVIDRFYEENGTDEGFIAVCDCFGALTNEEKLKDELLKLYKTLIKTKNALGSLLIHTSPDGDFMDTPHGKVLREHMLSLLEHYEGFYNYALNEIKGDEVAESALLSAFSSDLDYLKRLKELTQGGSYFEISELLGTFKAKTRGSIKEACSVDTDYLIEIRDAFKKAIATVKKTYFSSSAKTVSASFEANVSLCRTLYGMLSEFDSEYSKRKRACGVCDFNDISAYAYRLLYDENGNITPLARDVAASYDEVYVDEYQDTNYIQDRIFYAVSRKNRFLVGDIKQSIYGFRYADPEIFSSYRRTFSRIESDKSGPKSIFMSENFRCDQGVIDFSNTVSGFLFKNSKEIDYCEADALKFSKRDCDYKSVKAQVYIIDKTKKKDADAEEQSYGEGEDDSHLYREAEFVAEKIKELIKNGYLPNGKKIVPSDIAILLRSFKAPVGMYIDALEARGIKYQYRGDEKFFEKPEILLALCILNAIDNPLRDNYLAGAMRSEVFGFSLEDTVKIRQRAKDAPSFYHAVRQYTGERSLEEKIAKFLETLTKYREECRKRSAYEMISLVLSDTGIMAVADENEKKSLFKLYSIARSYEVGKYKGLYGFLRYVEGIKENSAKELLGSLDDDCVRLMSVHGSKGLEFEVCFVSGCGANMNGAKDTSDPILFHKELGISAYVAKARGLAKFNTLMRKCAAIAIKRDSVEEEMRMLYVAFTRARSLLYVTAGIRNCANFCAKCAKSHAYASEYSVLHPSCYMEWVLGALNENPAVADVHYVSEDEIIKAEPAPKAERAEADEGEISRIKDTLRARFDFEYPYAHLEKLPSKLSVSKLYPEILDGEENDEVRVKYTLDDVPSFLNERVSESTSAERGTATHVFMQFCDFERLNTLGAHAELERLVSEAYISEQSARLVNLTHIEAFSHSELFSQLLSAKNIMREFRFNVMLPASELSQDERMKNEKVLVQGVTDCIYENADGELILVDYKTDFVTSDNYVTVLTERHSSQLSYYKRACELMFGRPLTKALIYSVPLAKTVEI